MKSQLCFHWANLIAAQKQVNPRREGLQMFLFIPEKALTLENPSKVFQKIWMNGQGEVVDLLS